MRAYKYGNNGPRLFLKSVQLSRFRLRTTLGYITSVAVKPTANTPSDASVLAFIFSADSSSPLCGVNSVDGRHPKRVSVRTRAARACAPGQAISTSNKMEKLP